LSTDYLFHLAPHGISCFTEVGNEECLHLQFTDFISKTGDILHFQSLGWRHMCLTLCMWKLLHSGGPPCVEIVSLLVKVTSMLAKPGPC